MSNIDREALEQRQPEEKETAMSESEQIASDTVDAFISGLSLPNGLEHGISLLKRRIATLLDQARQEEREKFIGLIDSMKIEPFSINHSFTTDPELLKSVEAFDHMLKTQLVDFEKEKQRIKNELAEGDAKEKAM